MASTPSGEAPTLKYQIKDLPTRSVTLYPSRAHIVRDINDVVLQPGANEIVLHGITPTADEHSVQIDGKGAATITDITVELVPNREIFEEVYPELEEPDVENDESVSEDPEDPEEVKALTKKVDDLKADLKEANEVINSAARGLETLDVYAKSLRAEKSTTEDLTKTLRTYEVERAKIFARHRESLTKAESCQKAITENEKMLQRAWIPERRRRDKEVLAKGKEAVKKMRQEAEQRKERLRQREEKLKFFPKKVYRVVVSLEAAINMDTPASSRRGSMDSVTLARGYTPDAKGGDEPTKDETTTVSLSLSYVTKEASWTPRYDLSISSLQKVATIAYRAEFVNATSETWRDAQLILSTSQTSFQGLEDKVPFMHAWHVKLGRYNEQGLLSYEEQNKPKYGAASNAPIQNRHELFGSSQSTFYHGSNLQKQQQMAQHLAQMNQGRVLFGKQTEFSELRVQAPAGAGSGSASNVFSSASNAFGSSNAQLAASSASAGGMKGFRNSLSARRAAVTERGESLDALQDTASPPVASGSFQSRRAAHQVPDLDADDDEDDTAMENLLGTMNVQATGFDFQEAEWDDNGMTSTYEVPGNRTLAPSSLTRRHKIATLQATNINLSHIAVPKLRAAAFLRAKIRNPSSTVTLLKGVAGLTLDGAFLGNTVMDRVSPAQLFDLALGVDPAVHISYPKPSVHRSTQGIFNKESDQIFSRSVWVTNTKPVAIELLVLDQVPVSEDERLRIDILQPRGLSKEGETVRAGAAAKQGASGTTTTAARAGDGWGKATATLKKDGEISWTVNVEKKQACLLKLDYEAKMPASENIVRAS